MEHGAKDRAQGAKGMTQSAESKGLRAKKEELSRLFFLFFIFISHFIFCNAAFAKQDIVDIEFDSGMIAVSAENAMIEEILSKLSDKIGLKIQMRGEMPKDRISCNIKKLTIENALQRIFYRWDYVFLFKEEEKSIYMWLLKEKENYNVQADAGNEPAAKENISVPRRGKRKGLLGLLRRGR